MVLTPPLPTAAEQIPAAERLGTSNTSSEREPPRRNATFLPSLAAGSILVGLAAALALLAFYVAVLTLFGGIGHLGDQLVQDGPWVVILSAGFGLQAALLFELRRRGRLDAQSGSAAGAGGGASAGAMVACCAHHAADLLPLIGASGAAVFLTAYRTPLMLVGVVVTGIGIALSLRRLRRAPVVVGARADGTRP